MRFYEIEIDLQTKLINAKYKQSIEMKNIVNRALLKAKNNIEFKIELCRQIGTLLKELETLILDIYKNNNTEQREQNQTI
jgi:hypothetical protein